MSRKRTRPRLKSFQYTPPELNIEEFEALTDLLFIALNENNAACARTLGISNHTWRQWSRKPPTWPYWNEILRHIIIQLLANMESQRKSLVNEHRHKIKKLFEQIPRGDLLRERIDFLTQDIVGAQEHLRLILSKSHMAVDVIYRPANSGGYSASMLRSAARKLGVIRWTEGFGENKTTYWRLPTEADYLEDDDA